MKKTLLNSALTGTAGALALTIMIGAGPVLADELENESENTNVAANKNKNDATAVAAVDQSSDQYVAKQFNRDESVKVEDSLNNNDVQSHNDNDGLDLDLEAENIGNDYSQNYRDDSTSIEDVAILVSEQTLVGIASKAVSGFYVETDDIETGDVDFDDAYKMAAGSMTTSVSTGLSSNAQAATAIQANGVFKID